MDVHVRDLGPLAPDPLLDRARRRVRVRSSVCGSRPSVRKATRPPSVSRKRSSRGDRRSARGRCAARTPPRSRPPSAAGAMPSATSASGSRCVRTVATSGIAGRIASSTRSATSWASSSDSEPGSLRWSEISRRPPTSITFTLWISRTRGTCSAARLHPLAQGGLGAWLCGSTWTTTSASGSARRTASSTSSAAAWPCATAAPGGTPMTTSTKCRPGGLAEAQPTQADRPAHLRSIAWRAAARRAPPGRRSMSTSTFRRIRRAQRRER